MKFLVEFNGERGGYFPRLDDNQFVAEMVRDLETLIRAATADSTVIGEPNEWTVEAL